MKVNIAQIGVVFILFTFSCSNHNNKYKERYIDYTSLIKEAEHFVLDSNYIDAKSNYLKAFSLVKKPLASHCYTAIQVSAQIEDVNSFKVFLKKGLERGLTIEVLISDSLINGFLKNNNLTTYLTEEYVKRHVFYENSIDRFLKDTIQKLSELDNKWKVFYLDSLSNIDVKNKFLYWAKYDSIISKIVEKKLMPIIQEYGYPGERNLGYEKVGNNSYDFALVNNRAKLIFLHYYSFPRNCDYNQIFKDEVKKGNLLPEHFASIIDFQAKFGNGKYCISSFYNQWHESNDSTQINAINARRKSIGLETFQDLNEKYRRGKSICDSIKKGRYKHIKLFYWCG